MERTCSDSDCDERHYAKGLCRIHYNRQKRYGRTERVRKEQPTVCSVDKCGGKPKARGLCSTHYMRVRRDGETGTAESLAWRRRSKYRNVTCSLPGCHDVVLARGWCSMHYQRWVESGGENGGDPAGRWGAESKYGQGTYQGDGYRIISIDGRRRLEHHVIMERMLGRPLNSHETVHHRNGVRDDNHPDNLELWTRPQPNGQRVIDLVIWIVSEYPTEVAALMLEVNSDHLRRAIAGEIETAPVLELQRTQQRRRRRKKGA